jgi:3-hydroxypropanoate dehydrogenase
MLDETAPAPVPPGPVPPGPVPPSPVPPGSEPPAAEQAAEQPAPPAPTRVDAAGLDLLFRTARTHWDWNGTPVSDDELRSLYDLLKLGPTSANCSPARFLFLRSWDAKQRLKPALSAGNQEKCMAAPVVCIVAHDPKFYEDLPRLYPEADARAWFAGNEELSAVTAFRNGTLQGGYLIMAARSLGLDCGPMSGFDNGMVDSEFLVAMGWKSNFLVALGHGEASTLRPRATRLGFDEACRLL